MLTKYKVTVGLLLGLALMAVPAMGQNLDRDYDDRDEVYIDRIKIDRYLDVEIWSNHTDGDFYIGDQVVLSFRASRDAFVAIYSVDTKGRVNLIFPTSPADDNFIYGGVTYTMPGPDDEFDLVVTGPEGVENIQVVASRERFPIPDWHDVSGLLCDWDDRHDFMDYVNSHYFVRYNGQRFAFDRTALYVNEWEPVYYRPVYSPHYPSWTVCGNVYVDYPWGATIYVDGIYWGCTPLYIPRVYVGWHTITVYDNHHHCWESDFHVTRHHTLVLDRHVVTTRPGVMSKYKEVRSVGYRNPVKHGYPNYSDGAIALGKQPAGRKLTSGTTPSKTTRTDFHAPAKKYVRGSSKVIATDRGIQTAGLSSDPGRSKRDYSGSRYGVDKTSRTSSGADGQAGSKRGYSVDRSGSYGGSSQKERLSTSQGKVENKKSGKNQSKSKDYYQKKSGSKYRKSDGGSSKKGDSNKGRTTVKQNNPKPKKETKAGGYKVKSDNSGSRSKATTPTKTKSSGGSKTKSKSGKSKR